MSNPTDTPVINIAPEAETENAEAGTKFAFVQKAKTFVKTHKKSTIAVGALVGLVGVAALTGRKDNEVPAYEPLELMPADDAGDETVLVVDDTVTA